MVSRRIRQTFITLLLVAIALAAGGGWFLWTDYQRVLDAPLAIASDQETLVVPRGTGLRQLATQIADAGMLPAAHYVIARVYQRGEVAAIKAGEYQLTPGMTLDQLIDQLVAGRSLQFPVTLIEGRTFRQALADIQNTAPFQATLVDLSDAEIIARLGLDIDHPEGWFLPETYHFNRGATDAMVLQRAHQRMQTVLAKEWAKRDPDLPLETPYEALILASIIERETGRADERAKIAGVFVRRLNIGMRLQTDPTVIYGLGEDFDGRLRRADLQRDTPYNTYLHHHLPPTPIALPGQAAIHAALHPLPGRSLYFVSRGDGSHHFSATLAEHNCAVQRYIRGRECNLERFQ